MPDTPVDVAEELAALKAEKAALENQLKEQRAVMDKAKVPTPIPGKYKGHSFVNGHKHIRAKDGGVLPSAAIIQLATGKKVHEETLKKYPQLAAYLNKSGKDNGKAAALLDRFIKIKYQYLVTA